MLLDPGGMESFPAVVSAVSKEIDIQNIKSIFASHQDPDIASSLALWESICDNLDVYACWIWAGFIPHFGGGKKITTIPDEGMNLPLGESQDLFTVPAHYCHSSGNYSLYDPEAKILFSGDIGAAILPPEMQDVFVDDFEEHIQYMEAFHKRWMPSNSAKNDWISRVRTLDIDFMVPQHGTLFRRDDVKRFLDWFEQLNVKSAVQG